MNVSYKYLGSTGDNQVVQGSGRGFLYGILIGNAGTTLEISDSATDGDGNLIAKLTTPGTGYYPLNVRYTNGITCDVTNAADVTILYGP